MSVSSIDAACEIERRVQLTRERDDFTLAPKRIGQPPPQFGMEHPDTKGKEKSTMVEYCFVATTSQHNMHSRVHAGEYVLLRLPSDTLKLVQIVPNTYDPALSSHSTINR